MKIIAKDIGDNFYINIENCPLELRRKMIEYIRPDIVNEIKSYKEDLDIIIDSKDVSKESEKAFSNLTKKVNRQNLSDIDNQFLTQSINKYLKLRFKNLNEEEITKFDDYAADYFAKQFLPHLNNNLLNDWSRLKLEEKRKIIKEEVQKFNNPN